MGREFQMVGASVIVYRGGQVLLQKRGDSGCWGYHGGAVEMGEAVETAARRELFEETGLTANSLALFGVFSGADVVMHYPDGNTAHIVDVVYLCDDFSGALRPQPGEVTELQWFDIGAVPVAISPCICRAMAEFIRQHRA